MYASVETAVPFATALVTLCVFERVLSALMVLFLPMFEGGGLKQMAASQFLISLFEGVAALVTSVLYTLVSILGAAVRSLLWVTVVLLMGSMLYLAYEEFPWVYTDLARGYNAYLGPFMQNTLVALAEIVNMLFRGLIPVWNGLMFFIGRLLGGFVVPVLYDQFNLILSLSTTVVVMMKHLVLSAAAYVGSVVVNCPAAEGDACYDVSRRTLDLMTPMRDVQAATRVFVRMTRLVCGSASPVVDAVTYPLIDNNLGGAVHNLANAALYWLVQLSDVTYLRCTRHGGEGALMCTPDMEPIYTFLVAGLRSLGFLFNNWLDVVFVIVQNTLGFATVACSDQVLPSTLDPGPMREAMFGANQTVIVGLTGYLMAVTDGLLVAYEGRGALRIGSWPALVNVSHGVAAVTYGRGSDADVSGLSSASGGTSTAMLGCICAHDPVLGMQIQCSVLPYGGLLADETGVVPVFFQSGSTAQRNLQCSQVDVIVQSVRWPATRFSGGVGNLDCVTSHTCNAVDATLWVIPRSGACGPESALCDCYPYCMAIRLAGTQTAPLVLYSAGQWKGSVHMAARDCNIHAVSSSFVGAVTGSLVAGGVSTVQATAAGGAQFVSGPQNVVSCLDNLLVTSIMDRAMHPAYDTPTEAYLRNPDAPFAVTGDTILTAVQHGDGGYTVRVERLTGTSGNEFTLSLVSGNFPASPPPDVPSALFAQSPKDSLTIPYARLGTLGVSSREYVFFAVNPSTHVFDAYLRYCSNSHPEEISQFGLIMVSSYSPIRIWRVDAYRRCTSAGCGPNLVAQVDIPGAFSDGTFSGTSLRSDCDKNFSDAITQLEYVNEINIAVTVRYTDVSGSFVQYRTYWLHAETMQLSGPGLARSGPWVDSVPTTASDTTVLCPAMQVLPELGSLAAELAAAGVFLLKMPLDAVLYSSGIIHLWSSGLICPLQTRGHSVLQRCGAGAFSLDGFFASLQTATDLFWSCVTFVSALVGRAKSASFVENALNGIARYGAGSIDLWSARFKVLTVISQGPSVMLSATPVTVLTGVASGDVWAQGALKVSSNMLGWARFGYTAALKMVVTILQSVLANRPVTASGAWRIIVNTLDEMADSYDSYVVDNMRQSCAGVSLMFGLTNPWAVYLYQQCIAGTSITSAGLGVTLSVFNLAPFTQCMCSRSSGKVFAQHALSHCVPQASTTLRPKLLSMIQASAAPVGVGSPTQQLCANMIAYTKGQLTEAVQPWFDAQYASLAALANTIDYALIWLDPSAGDCLDFDKDPNVVVLLPWPQDYFQACGKTTLCRSKCSAVWNAFDAALSAAQSTSTVSRITVQAESLFFPTLSVDAFMPMRIWAMIQPRGETCLAVCGRAGDGCVAVAGVKGGKAAVQYYCLPVIVTSAVYRTLSTALEWQVEGSEEWVDSLTQLQFADSDGQFLVALASTGKVLMASRAATVQLADATQQTADIQLPVLYLAAVMSVANPPYACISLSLIYRLADGHITGVELHRMLVVNTETFPAGIGGWITVGKTTFFSQLQGFHAAALPSSAPAGLIGVDIQFLLLPIADGMPVYLWTARWDAVDVTQGVVSWGLRGLDTPPGLGALLGAGQILSQSATMDAEGAYIVLRSAPPDQSTAWLSELRVSGAEVNVYSSQRVPVTVQTSHTCGVSSCIGCPDGEVQSLCDAVQRCAVINCIGTPVNMRRVLCQVGQVVADYTRENLALTQGAWGIFVDMYMVLMSLSLQTGLKGIVLEWPDDRFFGYICTIKDNNAHMISIVTSSLNSVIQIGHSSLMYLQGGAAQIDPAFNSMATMPITALTGMVNQYQMTPLYAMVVTQKVLMCRINGVLAVFDSTGFTVRVGEASLEQASDTLVGQCLTQNYVVKSSNPTDASNAASVASVVSQVTTSTAMALLQNINVQGESLETIMHLIDADLSYWMGVVYGMSDMLQSLDMSHCKMPDHFLHETVFCACGDSPFGIPVSRRAEGLAGVGLWCTGTLTMLDAANAPFVIYNPYSFQRLQQLAVGTDAYLRCMSGRTYVPGDSGADCHSLMPSDPALRAQGVSVLSVLTTCKNNYMKKQWDQSAHVLFNSSLYDETVRGAAYPRDAFVAGGVLSDVGACLRDAGTRSTCQAAYMSRMGQGDLSYWRYENIAANAASPLVDACQVFTGPAESAALTPAQRSTFRACLDHYGDSNCQLSSSLWTPQSSNAVPVASMHGVRLTGTERVGQIVALKYSKARALVMEALEPLASYDNPAVLTMFFSPEGDIMHQMLDCVFMGPYTSVDYWPVDSERLLSIPEWYRDRNGSSRGVDARQCVQESADKEPPYSCGSPSRQAVIKYFFRDYLQKQQNAVLKAIVGSMVSDLKAAWGDESLYPCLCPDQTTHLGSCCAQTASVEGVGGWIPPGLTVEYQAVPDDTILRTLTQSVRDFYRVALENPAVWTKHLNAATLAAYDWSLGNAASVVTKEGLYRTDAPAVRYDATEANSPMIKTALWDQCHGLLSQVFFTIPMVSTGPSPQQWVPKGMPEGQIKGAETLAEFARAAVDGAYASSPLFRHYNVSHVPSDSRMCRPVGGGAASGFVATPPVKSVKVSSFSMGGAVLLDTAGWPGLPVYGTDAFPVHGCFCGWDGDGADCTPPLVVCASLPAVCPKFSAQDMSAVALIKKGWNQAWPCPALSLGDHSGAMDAGQYEDWLLGVSRDYSISGDSLLRRGRTGLRAGSFLSTPEAVRAGVSPADRVLEPSEAALPYCASSYEQLKGAPLLDEGMMRAFVTQLFPVGQGVHEPATAAYCLRYLVEAALLETMNLASEQMQGQEGLALSVVQQARVVDVWRLRCESQISLLVLCKNLDAFRPPSDPAKRFQVNKCPFTVAAAQSNDVYTTPGCLVHSEGHFYDPCNCAAFTCGASLPVFRTFTEQCRIPFDPRDLTVDAPLGRWVVSTKLTALAPGAAETLLAAADGLGNVPRGGSWSEDEGFLSATGLHCDLITDWWPDEQTMPVGYHATVPCSSDEAGYKTFDSAFAVKRDAGGEGEYTVVRMVYQHDATRNSSVVDTELGGGGVCRGSNLGMPLYQSNIMRVCTRQALGDDTLDIALPTQAGPPLVDSDFGAEACSTASWDTPWFDAQGRQDSALRSVGTVPNIPQAVGDTTYPPSGKFFGVGPRDSVLEDIESGGAGWGKDCSDFAIDECVADSDCPGGFRCLTEARVCLADEFFTGRRCYRHDMCPDDRMCDGAGECVPAFVLYLNTMSSPAEASVFSEQCDDTTSDTYHTDGSSPWEYVPDWLEGHGMCSNKNWYMYSQNLLGVSASGKCGASSCPVDASSAKLPLTLSPWWLTGSPQPAQFPVKPTVCDRDYEHMSGASGVPMRGCSPKSTGVPDNQITNAQASPLELQYARPFWNYQDKQTQMAKMPFAAIRSTGFLGMNPSDLWDGASTSFIQNCESVQNCYAYDFTFNGVLQPVRKYTPNAQSAVTAYNNNDIFRCGAAAFYDGGKCNLDLSVLPLYKALCLTPAVVDTCTCAPKAYTQDVIGCQPSINAALVHATCTQISQSYAPDYTTIQENTQYLQALFGVFTHSAGTLEAHVSGVECFEAIYASMQPLGGNPYSASRVAGVYYPFSFALYEMPFAWVYQCSFLTGIEVSAQASRVRCMQFERAQTLTAAEKLKGQPIDFTFVQGGYRRADVLSSISRFGIHVLSALPAAKTLDEVQLACQGLDVKPADCDMVSYCAVQRDWQPHASMDANTILFLAGLYGQYACTSTAQNYAVLQSGLSFSEFLANKTVGQSYTPEAEMPWSAAFPTVDEMIQQAVMDCIRQTYDQSRAWPLQFSFDTEMGLCFDINKVQNIISMQMVQRDNTVWSEGINLAYQPSENAIDNTVSLETTPNAPSACIYNDLAEQMMFYNPLSRTPSCVFANNKCDIACRRYPTTFQTGKINCQYPLPRPYISAFGLVSYVWSKLKAQFLTQLSGLDPYLPTPPSSLLFFEDSQLRFPGYTYTALGVQRYLSNINPDTSKQVMCQVTTATPVDFTTCNDANFAALAAFTDKLRQKGAAVVPESAQLRWRVSQSFLTRGALFAFANDTREPDQVLLSNIFNQATRCGVEEKMGNRVCLMQTSGGAGGTVRPWVPWLAGEWNPYDMCDVEMRELDQGNQEVIWPYDTAACPLCPGKTESTAPITCSTP
jgi:hypothetical protein